MKENGMTVESAQHVAIEFLKKQKNTPKVEISGVESSKEIWVIRGTCPIDLEGHPWAEKFEVFVDAKGKVKASTFALL